NTSQAVYGSHCLRPVEPGYQSAISATFGKREKQNAGAWCRYAQASTNLLWCCKTSERIPPTGSRLRCCERAGEMVSTSISRLPTTIGKHLAFIQQSRSLP